MSVMLCTGANCAKKNSSFVARIAPYYTAYSPNFGAITAQSYCTWSQSLYLTLMALL